MRGCDHLNDLGEHGFRSDFLCAHHQSAAGVHRRSNHLVAGALADGNRLAGQHGLVNGAAALDHQAIDRHFLAGADTQPVADMDMRQRYVFLSAIRIDAACRFWRQLEQGFYCRRSLGARLEFEYLAQQGQRNDNGSRLEIHAYATHGHEGGREHARGDGRHHAVNKRGAGAQPDQGPHVRAAMNHRLRSAFEEGPAGP